ncbi:MAG: hypothetical protein MH252_15965 [Thermosynechococcaceae cyanobacterium MS004]|nr:hypothetical protein [Thermosynechococcaceae cyanobacterium MS004]
MKTQWQMYQELELIPSPKLSLFSGYSIGKSASQSKFFLRSPIPSSSDLVNLHQQIDYMERCLALDAEPPRSLVWQIIWKILHPLQGRKSRRNLPRIESFSENGQLYWYGYRPTTGTTVFLGSEESAKRWLESINIVCECFEDFIF